jgi:hypothetical protein
MFTASRSSPAGTAQGRPHLSHAEKNLVTEEFRVNVAVE